jgi:hypothetical protein
LVDACCDNFFVYSFIFVMNFANAVIFDVDVILEDMNVDFCKKKMVENLEN